MATRIEKTDLARDALYEKVNTMVDELNTKIDNKDSLPSQTGKAGKFLTTDGTNASWGEVKQIKIVQNLTNPSANTVPSTKAVSNESSRIVSIMNNKIGEITSFVCSSTYIPKGCLPCNGGEYSKEQFKDLWNNYLVDGKLLTCTYTEYANDISTYGQCAKFAIDTINNKFKVPTIKDGSYITQALSDNELGKSYKESLPNITGIFTSYSFKNNYQESSGSFTAKNKNINSTGGSAGSNYGSVIYDFDASRSSSTYQDGAKVQGDNVRLRFFVVVANGEINQSIMDWSAWATSLNNKANITLDNVNPAQSFKKQSVGWSIPDYNSGITLTFNKVITNAGESKTMAKSGLFCFEFLANNVISTIYFYVNNNFVGKIGNSKTSVAFWDEINFPVTKGDVVKVKAETDGGFTAVAVESYLFPYKGSMYE